MQKLFSKRVISFPFRKHLCKIHISKINCEKYFSVWIFKNPKVSLGLWTLQDHEENMSLFKCILLKPSQTSQGHCKPNCMAWTRFFHKQKGWKGDNCERAPSTGTSFLNISLRLLGKGISVSLGLASYFPGSPLLSRSLETGCHLSQDAAERAVSASPGWDSPLSMFAGAGVHQHSFFIRDKT